MSIQTKTGSGSSATTATVTLDLAPTVGNTMVACFGARTAATAPAGWESFTVPLGNVRGIVAWRVVQGGDTGVTFTLPSGNWACVLSEHAGLLEVQADLLDQSIGIATTAATETAVTVGYTGRPGTTTSTDELLIAMFALLGGTDVSGTWSNSFTQIGAAQNGTGSSDVRVMAAERMVTAIGEYSTETTWTTARRFVGAIITLRATAEVTNPVEWAWVGAQTHSSIEVVARVTTEADCRLVVSTSVDLTSPVYSAVVTADDATERIVRLARTGLTASTDYFYGIEVDGTVGPHHGRFSTAPSPGPADFMFAFASCGGYRDNGAETEQHPMSTIPVWDRIADHDPLFFLHTGDFHYQDVETTSITDHTAPFHDVLTSQKQGVLWRYLPIAYMWDDHDYCANDSQAAHAGRDAALAAYRRAVPHHPLQSDTVDDALHYGFTVGRVRFLVTDCRSDADPRTKSPDDTDKTRLGQTGRAWVTAELAAAEATQDIGLVMFVTSIPWNRTPTTTFDEWSAYTWERDYIAALIDGMDTGIIIVHSDAHMIAVDDGTNNPWGDCPIICAAALAREGSDKGGEFSSGKFLNSTTPGEDGQFALITITDDEENITVDFSGRNVTAWNIETTVLTEQFVFPAPYEPVEGEAVRGTIGGSRRVTIDGRTRSTI